MTDALVETLRLRGPGAVRLTRIAATALPEALDRALAGMPDSAIDEVVVRLDLDPADYDDATIATLWADAIRAEVVRQVGWGAGSPSVPDAVVGAAAAAPAHAVTLGEGVAAAQAWLSKSAPRGAVPVAALSLASAVAEHGDPTQTAEARELLLALDAELMAEARGISAVAPRLGAKQPGAEPVVDMSTTEAVPHTSQPMPASGRQVPGEADGDAATSLNTERDADTEDSLLRAAARVGALAELVPSERQDLDLATVTRAAGLVLLYPWLADLCRDAVRLNPGLDEATVRAFALATVVGEEDGAMMRDPFVGFLAGLARDPEFVAPPPRADEVREAAGAVLASFAALLPGFEASTPEFVRREWIARIGILDRDADPVIMTAATHPLDVMLHRLPYPFGLFRLPWAPPVMVRFRP